MTETFKDTAIIYGAGGFAKELASWLYMSKVSVLGFYTDNQSGPEMYYGMRVFKDLTRLPTERIMIGVGDPKAKKKIFEKLVKGGFDLNYHLFATGSICGLYNQIGPGSIICPNSILTTNIFVGQAAMINIGCTIGHDCIIGDYVTVSPGANISGNVSIGEGAYIGTNAVVREKIKIGAWSTVGAGAVVVKDVPPNTTVVGNPAREMTLVKDPTKVVVSIR